MIKLNLSQHTLREALSIIDKIIKNNDFDSEKALRLRLIYEELITNIFKYAVKLNTGYVYIELEFLDKIIKLKLKYNGELFDPTKFIPEKEENVEQMKMGGLGIFLVKKMSKSFEYKRENRENIIVVKI